MNPISSVDNYLYPNISQRISPAVEYENAPAVQSIPTEASSTENAGSPNVENVDLSSYYSNIRPEDMVANSGDNVTRAAKDLDKAMVSALQSGMSVNDVINIKAAHAAYQASNTVFNATFALEI